jgi:hypothetical protein
MLYLLSSRFALSDYLLITESGQPMAFKDTGHAKIFFGAFYRIIKEKTPQSPEYQRAAVLLAMHRPCVVAIRESELIRWQTELPTCRTTDPLFRFKYYNRPMKSGFIDTFLALDLLRDIGPSQNAMGLCVDLNLTQGTAHIQNGRSSTAL